MTDKEFFKRVANGESDIVQILLSILEEIQAAYCVIGGLAVNAYAEPVVSLDLDLVVSADRLPELQLVIESKGMKIEEFEHSINFKTAGSDLRIQIQTDLRYQAFIARAGHRNLLGYEMSVASLEDVLSGKIWAYSDPARRRSKRQKDLADIMRLIENHPELKAELPENLLAFLE